MTQSFSRSYSIRTIKTLFGLSAGRCMFPGCEMAMTEAVPSILDICQVKSVHPGGPRCDPNIVLAESNNLDNLILLCQPHHSLVDRHANGYPAERLLELKRNHYRRVKAMLDGPGPSMPLDDVLIEQSSALGSAYRTWLSNKSNSSEEHWQKIFSETPTCFMPMLGPRPYVLKGKAYVGGKNFDNHRGNILDFLAFYRSNVACIEIKSPTADLMGDKYRTNSYLPSKDLAGGVAQVLESRRSLLEEFSSLNNRNSNGEQFRANDPTCFLVIGNAENLEPDKLSSFELYRRNLRDVSVYTYDEVFNGISTLLQAVGNPDLETLS